RKKFMIWGLGVLSSVTILSHLFNKKKKKETVKMLTREGKLVEVDISVLKSKGKKISDDELKTWIKN
ncbi:MAG: hypothetical protein ACHQK8_08235, partial [Bacteroidia bacterium]